MASSPRRTGLTILIASAIATIFLVWVGWTDLQSSFWPVATGTVVHGVIRSFSTRNGPYYEVSVAYEFTVGERSYAGSTIRFDQPESFGSMEGADRRIEPYREGKLVSVRYDPRDPWQSVLEPGPTSIWKKAMAISVLGFLLGVFLLLLPRTTTTA